MDPERLKEGGASPFELAALRAAESDVGSERAMRRAVAALGASTMMAAPAAAVTAPKGVSALLVAKWLGLGAVVGLGFGMTATAVSKHQASSGPVTPVSSAPYPGDVARSETPRGADPGHRGSTPLSPLPDHAARPAIGRVPAREKARKMALVSPKPPRVDVEPAPSAPTRETQAQLTREIALLDQARAALGRGDGALALSVLDQRQQEVGQGMLGPEATVTRVEALLRQKNTAQASAVVQTFLAAHPGGPHADRLRSLLAKQIP